MKNNEALEFSLGLLIGGVVGFYLSSDEGREMRHKAVGQIRKVEQEVRTKVSEKTEVVTEKLQDATIDAKHWASDLSETVKEKIGVLKDKMQDEVEETVEEVEEDFESGALKARRVIEERSRTIDNLLDNTK